jgi:hypothetical protein
LGVSGQRQAPAALYPQGKELRYKFHRSLGGPQNWSRHRGYGKHLFFFCQGSNSVRAACSQTLCWLSHPSSFISPRIVLVLSFHHIPGLSSVCCTKFCEHYCPSHLSHKTNHVFVTILRADDLYKSRSPLLNSMQNGHLTSSLFGPVILLSTVFK